MNYIGAMKFALDLGKLGSVSGDNKIAGVAAIAALGIGAIGYSASSLKHAAKAKKVAKKECEATKIEEDTAADQEQHEDDEVEIVVEEDAAEDQEQCDAAATAEAINATLKESADKAAERPDGHERGSNKRRFSAHQHRVHT